jgi:PAS domain S-box-containing protein
MEEDKNGLDNFVSVDKFITELIGYHEKIKQLMTSETHYKKLAGTLQENLKKYQTIVAHLPQKVFLKDKNSSYLFANENYSQSLGVAAQNIPGKTDHDFFPVEVAEQRLNDDRRFMERGHLEEKEERNTVEGGVRVEQILKIPVKNESGDIVGIMGISWDITEKKAKEEALERKAIELARLQEVRMAEWKELSEKYQAEQAKLRRLEEEIKYLQGYYGILFENTGTAVAVIEDNRVISRVNAEFEKFSGYPRKDVEGAKNWNELIPNGYPENMGESTGSARLNSLDPGKHVVKFVDRQNKGKIVSLTAARIPDTNRVMVSLIDITKHRQAREELNRIMKQFMEWMAEMERGVRNLDG